MKVIFLRNYKNFKIGDKAFIENKEELEYLKKTKTVENYVETTGESPETKEIELLKKQLEDSEEKIKNLEKENKKLVAELKKYTKEEEKDK